MLHDKIPIRLIGMAEILAMRLSRPNAQKLLREWAKETRSVFFTDHAKQRMRERGITNVQILRCLRLGAIVDGPVQTLKGGWKLDVRMQSSGDDLEVVVELNLKDQIIVITVYNR